MKSNKLSFFIFLLLILEIIFPNYSVSQNVEIRDKIDTMSVYDYEAILSSNEKKVLEETILKFKKHTPKDILIATTNSIGPMKDIQEYATYLREVYTKDTNNEEIVVIAISKTLRKIGISTSDKSRQIVSDKICEEIINHKMIPEFAKGNFF
ncbi:TPM domain-containing protein [Flavobacterium aestivum]|uniref:TPM domain-containing protein n=1 Tax=Flavobacterium aestivum TaxID=3003257 RepID=UPI0024823279|nr:TPM domain-containing protein [Flavobacterium aestivum]